MARNQGLIDFNAFLGGIESAQRLNRQNQLLENQIFRENREIMEMLQTDEEKRIKRDAGRYLSTIPLNRISAAARDQSGMSSADHAIAQLRAIEQDPYFQQNTPEFQNEVLNSLAESAAVQMQQYLKSGEVNELAKLAEAFGQVDPLAQGTRAAARGASQTEANAINRQWGTSFQVDPEGNITVGEYTAPAGVVLAAAARGGHAQALSAAMEWAQAQQGIQAQQKEADINRVYQALALQQMGVAPSVLESLGLPHVPLIPGVQPQVYPEAASTMPQMNVPAGGVNPSVLESLGLPNYGALRELNTVVPVSQALQNSTTAVVPTQTVPPSNKGVSTNTSAGGKGLNELLSIITGVYP